MVATLWTEEPPPGGHDAGGERHALVGPRALWREKREFQIRFLRANGLLPAHRMLDLGCGTLRGGVPLIAYLDPRHYTGIDVRPQVIAEAWRECDENGLWARSPTLLCCKELAHLSLPGSFDLIWAFSVLIHMDDITLDSALGFVRRHLEAGGRFLANVNLGERPDGQWQGFPLVWRSLAFYDAAFRRHGLRMVELGALGLHGHRTRHRDPGIVAGQRMLRATHAAAAPD